MLKKSLLPTAALGIHVLEHGRAGWWPPQLPAGMCRSRLHPGEHVLAPPGSWPWRPIALQWELCCCATISILRLRYGLPLMRAWP
jgi:hypothetical protein